VVLPGRGAAGGGEYVDFLVGAQPSRGGWAVKRDRRNAVMDNEGPGRFFIMAPADKG